MSTYKLTYFPIRGRAELSRYVFAQAGVEYEDMRVEKQDWPQLKPNTPSGVLPILDVDGKQVTGSVVIARFLAERFGLAGSNDVENAEIAGIVDLVQDFKGSMMQVRLEKDEKKKAQLQEKLKKDHVPKYWGIIEKKCEKNNSADGWIYGNKPTYADFSIFNTLEYFMSMVPTFAEDFPRVAKLKAAVEALPNIAKWLETRPVTEI